MGKSFPGGEKSVVINRTPEGVFDYLAYMSRHHEWGGETGLAARGRSPGWVDVRNGEERNILRPAHARGRFGRPGGHGQDNDGDQPGAPLRLSFETKNRYNRSLHSAERVWFGLTPEGWGTRLTLVTGMESMLPGSYVSPLYALHILKEPVLRIFSRWAHPKYPALFVGPYLSRIPVSFPDQGEGGVGVRPGGRNLIPGADAFRKPEEAASRVLAKFEIRATANSN